ncbi:hypothetical protein V6V47_07940 [Micromonospora sp. CPCC 205539]|uniref:hypothetical protein n=1 Tax=Micromonospora sp. CPCC 205539 TaxID=3122408 RepID=UPI002FEF26BD
MSMPPATAHPRPGRQGRGGTVAWIVVGATIVGVLALGCVGVSVAGFWMYANHDRIELIDSPQVSEVAERACASMRATVVATAVSPGATPAARVRSLREQDTAVTAMVAQVRSLGSDRLRDDLPTTDWLTDWESLVAARERYADALSAGGDPHFEVPTADGRPIVDRMNRVGLTCEVPPQLVDLP